MPDTYRVLSNFLSCRSRCHKEDEEGDCLQVDKLNVGFKLFFSEAETAIHCAKNACGANSTKKRPHSAKHVSAKLCTKFMMTAHVSPSDSNEEPKYFIGCFVLPISNRRAQLRTRLCEVVFRFIFAQISIAVPFRHFVLVTTGADYLGDTVTCQDSCYFIL